MYPIWKHHKEHKAKLVKSAEELKVLGEGWGDDSSVWRPHLIKEEVVEIIEPKKESIQEFVEEKRDFKKGKKHASKEVSV